MAYSGTTDWPLFCCSYLVFLYFYYFCDRGCSNQQVHQGPWKALKMSNWCLDFWLENQNMVWHQSSFCDGSPKRCFVFLMGNQRYEGKDCVPTVHSATVLCSFSWVFFFLICGSVSREPGERHKSSHCRANTCSASWFFFWFDFTYHGKPRWLQGPGTESGERGKLSHLEVVA